jgi:DNA polymerase III delta subunit
MMLYILAGPDDFSRTQTLYEIKRSLGDPSILDISTTVLEGQKITIDELKHACETVPFMSEKTSRDCYRAAGTSRCRT